MFKLTFVSREMKPLLHVAGDVFSLYLTSVDRSISI